MTTLVHSYSARADTIVSDMEDGKQELDPIRGAPNVNGYPDWMLGECREEVRDKVTNCRGRRKCSTTNTRTTELTIAGEEEKVSCEYPICERYV